MTLTPGFRAKEDASHHRPYIIFAATNTDLSICKSQMALSYENLYDAINICVFRTLTCWSPVLVQVEQSLCIQKQGLSGSELGHRSGTQYHSTGFLLGDTKELACHTHLFSPWRRMEGHTTYKPRKGASKEHPPRHSLILDFSSLKLWDNAFLPFKSPTPSWRPFQQVKLHFYKDIHPSCPYISGTAFSCL